MEGYDKLASLIGSHHELAIFRNFGALNAKNILYMQAELVHLESQLSDIVLEDKHSKDTVKHGYQYSLYDLMNSSGKPEKDIQWQKALEIRG